MLRKNNGNDGSRMYQFGTKWYSSEEILEKLEKGEISFEDFLNKCYIGEDLTDEEIEDDRREAMKIFADAFVVKQLQEKKIEIVILDEDDKPVEKKDVKDNGKYKIAISYGDKNYSVSDFSFSKKAEASESPAEVSEPATEAPAVKTPEKFAYVSEGKIVPEEKVNLLKVAKKTIKKVIFTVGKEAFSIEDAAYLSENGTTIVVYDVSAEEFYPTRLDDEEVNKLFADYKKSKKK